MKKCILSMSVTCECTADRGIFFFLFLFFLFFLHMSISYPGLHIINSPTDYSSNELATFWHIDQTQSSRIEAFDIAFLLS